MDKEKLKIAEDTHYKLQKTKGKLHLQKWWGIELQSTSSWSESMRMEKSVTKMGQRPSSENGQKMYLKNS